MIQDHLSQIQQSIKVVECTLLSMKIKKKCPRSLVTISLEKAWQYIIQFIMKPVNNNMRH